MEKPSRALLISVSIALALGLAVNLIAWLEPACRNESRRIIMKAAGGVGCFEFWLNRYQSLIGSVLTAGVAGVTLFWLAKQLIAVDRQVAAADRQAGAAAAAALRGSLPDFDADAADLGKIAEIFGASKRILDVPRPPDASLSVFEFAVVSADRAVTKMQDCFGQLEAIQSRATTQEVFEAAIAIQMTVGEFFRAAEPIITAGHRWNEERIEPQGLVASTELPRLNRLLDDGISSVNRGLMAAWGARDRTWRRIRAAEDAATQF